MMQEQEIKTGSAPCSWAAIQDARNRNIANASKYSESKKAKAEGMKYALELVYGAKDIYVNFRKTFIAVKIDSPFVKDKKTLLLLEADWEKQGIVKVRSAQGIVYRIPA